jgi:hypothetical protein
MSDHVLNTPQDFQVIQKEFSDSIRDPKNHSSVSGINERHMSVYRELFYNNIEGFISGGFPVLMEILTQEQQSSLVRDFFIKHACHSPYFLKISEEFLEYLTSCQLDFLPEFAYQLAHWEWMELHADVYQESSTQAVLKTLDTTADIVSVIECAWCQVYDYPVHKISAQMSAQAQCEPKQSYLMVFRDQALDVGFNELNPLSAMLFQRLKDNQVLSANAILKELALQYNMDEEQVVQGGSEILQQWCHLGLIVQKAR